MLSEKLLKLDDFTFWIPGEVPSSKNSKVKTKWGLMASGPTKRWIVASEPHWLSQKEKFKRLISKIPKPYYIEMTFVRRTKGIFDYPNIGQGPADEMQRHGWIDNDKMDDMVIYYGKYLYDPISPGIYIRVLKEKPVHEGEIEFRELISQFHPPRTKKEIKEHNKLFPRKKKAKK